MAHKSLTRTCIQNRFRLIKRGGMRTGDAYTARSEIVRPCTRRRRRLPSVHTIENRFLFECRQNSVPTT